MHNYEDMSRIVLDLLEHKSQIHQNPWVYWIICGIIMDKYEALTIYIHTQMYIYIYIVHPAVMMICA